MKARLALLFLFVALFQPALAQSACLDADQVRALAHSGDVVPAAAALSKARAAAAGEIIDTKICGAPGAWRYVVTILGQDGRVVRVTLDARNAAVLSTR